jgi:alkylhydroperoxidase/carboxymuconolactone decarboxylase family protein YurZ
MSDIRESRKVLVSRTLAGDGKASLTLRMAAFNNSGLDEPLNSLINKVAMNVHTITDDDIDAVKRSGLSEDQIFEMMVCAAIGQATRQYDSAIAALEKAIKED